MSAANPARLTCPACSRRAHQRVSTDCPVCAGNGTLLLGRLLRRYPADVMSRAVAYCLETQAQQDLARTPVDLAEARRNQTGMVAHLVRVGLLAAHPVDPDPAPPPVTGRALHGQAVALAEEATGLPYQPGTAAVLAAPPVQIDIGDVPVDLQLPGFSAAGFLAGLARVADPLDVLVVRLATSPTPATVDRAGEVLGRAATAARLEAGK